jgi:hypothetical protein
MLSAAMPTPLSRLLAGRLFVALLVAALAISGLAPVGVATQTPPAGATVIAGMMVSICAPGSDEHPTGTPAAHHDCGLCCLRAAASPPAPASRPFVVRTVTIIGRSLAPAYGADLRMPWSPRLSQGPPAA